MPPALEMILLLLLAVGAKAGGIGTAWDISPSTVEDTSSHRPSWPKLESSAFEVHSISGVGRLSTVEKHQPLENYRISKKDVADLNGFSEVGEYSRSGRQSEDFEYETEDLVLEDPSFDEEFFRSRRDLQDADRKEYLVTRSEIPDSEEESLRDQREPEEVYSQGSSSSNLVHVPEVERSRVRREADKDMEKISGTKNVREARLGSPESWSKQPVSVEFRHRVNLDQVTRDNFLPVAGPNRMPPKTDFVTSQRRDFPETRESRDLPFSRSYDDYVPMYPDRVQERVFDVHIPRGYYPDRYRTERDYYPRGFESQYYPNRYHEDDLDSMFGRARPKPKRVIYYATLPEVVRKPVDLRNYERPYEGSRSPAVPLSSAGSHLYKRVPGNVDPNRYRYRPTYLYDNYDPYSKKMDGFYSRPYPSYLARVEDDGRPLLEFERVPTKENLRGKETPDSSEDRKLESQIASKDYAKVPWPVHIGAEVNVKDDERIPGRKILGQVDSFNGAYNSARLQQSEDSAKARDGRLPGN
ncbi:uncharacterized protein LOC105700430 [Orussus abietinus]|uniref:uncharacterized protein LOC105700430 n=1 Tax=Orussus abietinus TaxID=222816 RepID=UPI0006262426|nr:uncharacterized protein LOC105700430 [Orussus abietinus]